MLIIANDTCPQSYAEAQADAVPPYWETTVHAPSTDPDAPMIIDDLPTGSPWLFFTNLFISFFFQFIGFLFTYLLHTSHAAKYGSRAGLGVTLIQFGLVQYGGALRNAAWGPGSASATACARTRRRARGAVSCAARRCVFPVFCGEGCVC